MSTANQRRLPIGAELVRDGAHFRVWAPKRKQVRVVTDGSQPHALTREPGNEGYFSTLVPSIPAGARYHYLLDDDTKPFPDPVSRYQPEGPHGPSVLVDPSSFPWTDRDWKGLTPHGQVLYELHVGTFSKEGTFAAASQHLEYLKDVGITCIEVMPLNEFAGRWGWGYDGVQLFAPFHHYGTPDDLRRFIDKAHALGVGLILDLVYNHLGPDGNYLPAFSDHYHSCVHCTDWGDALNFDAEHSAPVREFFLANALHWIREYHFDGFRFDATQSIVDNSADHILAVICRESRKAAGDKSIYIINENEPQHTKLVRPQQQGGGGGYGMDALWNDDFHHTAMVALTGRNEAYYSDYLGTPQELLSSAKYGYLYQGQRYKWHKRRRGTPALDLPPTAFVHFLQNHDQIANSGTGLRACQLSGPGQIRAMTALLLLMPQTPMLFQGQEFAASAPFFYFSDHNPELAKLIRAGRLKELTQFPSVASVEMQSTLIDPSDPQTFHRSKLDHAQREQEGYHRQMLDLHRDLLRIRREDAAFRRVPRRGEVDGAVLGPEAFAIRFFVTPAPHDDRLLLVNLGRDLTLDPAPEPLLAPPADHHWHTLFSTEHPNYGGSGTPAPDTQSEGWHLPGRCAVLLRSSTDPLPQSRLAVPGSDQSARVKETQNLSP